MAEAQEAAIRAYLKAGSQAQPPWPKPLIDSDQASLEVRHSGPLVVVVSGDAIPDESHRLLESVHYEANLTAIPQPVESEVEKTSQAADGNYRADGDRGSGGNPAGRVPGRRQGTLPPGDGANRSPRCSTRSSFISICGKKWNEKRRQFRGRIRRVNAALRLWKNGQKPEETRRNHGKCRNM